MATITSNDEDLLELALFAGAGGGILGGKLLGWRTICAVERDAYAAQVLAQRQNDGILEAFPIWSDVCSFRADNPDCANMFAALRANAHRLVISGGFPCQDISAAGKGAGITGARSGLWKEFARIIGELQPRYAFIENSPRLTVRGLDVILCDLAKMGFDAEWGCILSGETGGNCEGERAWIVAETMRNGRSRFLQCNKKKHASTTKKKRVTNDGNTYSRLERIHALERMADEPAIYGGDYEVSYRVDRIKAIGNAQDAVLAATAFTLLDSRIENNLF